MSNDRVAIPTDGGPYRVNMTSASHGVSIQFIARPECKPVLIIQPDGRIVLGEGCTNADAAQVLVDLANKVCAERASMCGVHRPVVDPEPSAWLLMDKGIVVGSATSRKGAEGWARGPQHAIEPLHRIMRGP